MFPTFEIFGKTIGMYGVCAVLGLAACVIFATRVFKKIGLFFEDVMLICAVVSIGILLGGSFLYGLTHIRELIHLVPDIDSFKKFIAVIRYCFGGSVFYGGFFGMILALNIYMKHMKFKDKTYIKDGIYTSIPLFHCFGRIGCFLGGCCYGIESAFGFITYDNKLSPGINGVRRFPVSLLESLINLIIFLILYFAFFKRGKCKGSIIYIYMLMYPFARFFIEFLRDDAIRGFIGPFSTSQWISIILFVVAVCVLTVKHFKNKNQKTENID